MAFNSIRLAGVAIAVTIGIASAPSAQAASFIPLGYLPGGGADSRATGISADGLVVVGSSNSSNGTEAFRWTQAGGMVGLGSLPGTSFNSNASAVSADGSVVVGYSNGREPFRWTQSGGIVGLGSLSGGFSNTRLINNMGVSADGSVVVGQSAGANGPEAFRWTQSSGMVGLGDLPGGKFASGATGVSADGSVVVGYANANSPEQPFRWTEAGGMVGLGNLSAGSAAFGGGANAVSADGSVVVGYSLGVVSGIESFRWTQAGGMVGLGYLSRGGYFSSATGVSVDGSVVVGQSPNGFTVEPHAFIWTEAQGMLSLQNILTASGVDLSGWKLGLGWATGVSANGRTITGFGRNSTGNYEAWIAQLDDPTPIPEPTSLVVLGLIGMGLGGARKRGEIKA
jgi:probable HAF family extracellular repeat protein